MRWTVGYGLVAAVFLCLGFPTIQPAFPESAKGWIAFADGGSIWTVRPNGTERKRLTRKGNDTSPAWSRDGRHLAFVRQSPAGYGIGAIHIIHADGTGDRVLVAGQCWSPIWSPVADELAYVRGHQGQEATGTYIAFINSKGQVTRKSQLHLPTSNMHSTTTAELCSWDRNGSRLSVTLRGYLFSDVEELSLSKGGLQRRPLFEHKRTQRRQDDFVYHAWAPDGTGRDLLVRYGLTYRETGSPPKMELDADLELSTGFEGRSERQSVARPILGKERLPLRAAWSRDGRLIAFESDNCIFITDAKNPHPRKLTSGNRPKWSPN